MWVEKCGRLQTVPPKPENKSTHTRAFIMRKIMIRITKGDGYITIEGHAGYAEHGRDIVCAGVTALVETLIKSIEELTPNSAGYTAEPGLVRLRIGSPTEDTKLLVRAFFIGAENIAEQFPDNVQVSGTE